MTVLILHIFVERGLSFLRLSLLNYFSLFQKKYEAIAALLEKSKEEYADVIQSKDLKLEELNRVTIQQAEKQEQIQTTTKELQNSLALETQR